MHNVYQVKYSPKLDFYKTVCSMDQNAVYYTAVFMDLLYIYIIGQLRSQLQCTELIKSGSVPCDHFKPITAKCKI